MALPTTIRVRMLKPGFRADIQSVDVTVDLETDEVRNLRQRGYFVSKVELT